LCGIAGFTHRNYQPDPERIHRVTSVLVHRGPDQQGVFESPSISLGAVRLSIIDLAGGDQPVRSDDGDAVAVFNGEIYNHAELRRELEQLGHRFHSRCDTEVVLRAFLQWDKECFRRLRGMFGIALWTESERRLVLARDRMGIKPLYLHWRGEELYFGSELKAILHHPEVERRISPEGLNYYLSLNYVPCPWTLIGGITKLEPGHWLEWRDGAVTTGAFWRLALSPEEISLEDAKSELDALLRQSIAEHMTSDVPLGMWASGGIDSSTILHYASQASSAPLKTFSVSFRGRSFDESSWFREVAERYKTDHHEFDLNPGADLAGAIEQMVWFSDEPSADAGALPVWYLSRLSRRHVTVALSGEGADELFGGYYTYLADQYARRLRFAPAALRRLALACASVLPVSDEKIGLDYRINRFLKGSLLEPSDAHLFWNGTSTAAERRRLLQGALFRDVAPLVGTLPASASSIGFLNRYLWLDQLYYLADDILYKCDRMSMAHSLEVRPAFLDHRIVEFAARLPEEFKVRGRTLKFVLRELMRGKLPDSVLSRKKEGFDIPAHDWIRTVLRELLSATITEKSVTESGLLRWGEVSRLMSDHFERRANLGYHLWGLLILFLWIRRWRVEAHPRIESGLISAGALSSATN
jgi:asparagine synthase (glutamine-hydrolysing)